MREEALGIEEDFKEKERAMRKDFKDKVEEIKFLKAKGAEIDLENHNLNSTVGSMFYNLGYEHKKAQENGQVPLTWLGKNRKSAYSTKYNFIFGTN